MELYLVRHAQRDVEINYDKLNWLGAEQAKRIGPYFKNKKIDFVYCSPQNRARQTLKEIVPYLENPKIKVLEIFRQMGAPEEVGAEVIKKFKIKIDTEAELENRTLKIIEFLKKNHKNDSVLMVGHKEVIKSLICKLFNLPPTEKLYIEKIASGSISYFKLDNKFNVKKALIGEITHLLLNPPYPVRKIQISKEAGSSIVRAIIPKNLKHSEKWLKENFIMEEISQKTKNYKIFEINLKNKSSK
jgi:probable phosphoglycerate mutase